MNFKTKPYDHQRAALMNSRDMKYFAYFMEMGTGKTKVTIDNICYLRSKGEIDTVIISAPKGVYANWSNTELPIHMWDDIEYEVALYSASMRVAQKRKVDFVLSQLEKLRIIVINIESFVTKKGLNVAINFAQTSSKGVMTVIDESTCIKNHKSKRAKGAMQLSKLSKYKRILTGTPITNNPLDLYSQCEFLCKGASGHPSYWAFKHRYAILEPMVLGNRSFEKIVGFANHQELTNKLNDYSYRVLKTDCLDLPDKIYLKREVEMTASQKKMYDTLKTESLVLLENGILTSTNALTTLNKLQQIACGHVKDDFGNVNMISDSKIRALEEILHEIDNKAKVIIWCNFQKDVELVKKWLGDKAVTYYGKNNDQEREDALNRFKAESLDCRFFIGTPQCSGKGLTLNNANYVIYYSNSFKLEDRLQSEDRCHRIGQTKNVTYIDIVTSGTVDEKVLMALRDKHDLAEKILADVESFADYL